MNRQDIIQQIGQRNFRETILIRLKADKSANSNGKISEPIDCSLFRHVTFQVNVGTSEGSSPVNLETLIDDNWITVKEFNYPAAGDPLNHVGGAECRLEGANGIYRINTSGVAFNNPSFQLLAQVD